MNRSLFPSQKNYLQKFNKEEDSLVLEMEKFAAEHKIPILYPEAALFLEQLILLTRPKRVLEIGTAIAYSSIRMARQLRKKGIIQTIEKSEDNIKLAAEYVKRSGYDDKIEIIKGDAIDLLPAMNKKYDLICTDHRMPIVNGGKFVVYLRGREGLNQQTPILIITGHYDKVKQYQMALKHVYVHVKPVIPQELYSICDLALTGVTQDLLDK